MTWLPTMAVGAGISNSDAALLASIFSLISIPFSMICSKSDDSSIRWYTVGIMLAIISIAGMTGIAMLLYPTNNFLYWLVVHLLIGTACSRPLPLPHGLFSLKTSSPERPLSYQD